MGERVSPPLSTASVAVWAYLAFASYNSGTFTSGSFDVVDGNRWLLYGLAGVAIGNILPYTLLVMMTANNILMKQNKIAEKNGAETISNTKAMGLLEGCTADVGKHD